MMKAIYITKWCEEGTVADSVVFGEIPRLSESPVGKTDVVIEVKASAINADDVALCQDTAAGGWYFHGRKPSVENPFIGGMEYSGVVLAIGTDVTNFKVGDRVCGIQDVSMQKNPGTWAEQTLAPEKDIVAIPAECNISFVEAAAVGMGAFVAGDMYKRASLPSQGDVRCLVYGASGGLGTILLQILKKHKGANVYIVGVCSSSNNEKVRRLGANDTIDYKVVPFGKQFVNGEKFDYVFDFVGGIEVEQQAKRLMKKGAKFITACGPMRAIGDRQLTCCEWHGWACGLCCRIMKSSCCCCCVSTRYEMAGEMPPMKASDFNSVAVEAGIRAEIGMEVPFAETPVREAIRCVASRHTGGKIVINMEKIEALNGQDKTS
jgi:NADPH:quinone reductase-like Zn-dependent oxidoreductase